MKKLLVQIASRAELAQLLVLASLEESREVGGATVYQLKQDGHEKVAISMPDGGVLIVASAGSGRPRRRRAEPA
jgi:hypothetical protein